VSFLFTNPSSLVELQSVASFVKLIDELSDYRWTGENDMHDIFDSLIPNLWQKNHSFPPS
jgi:hypothetical protein